MMIDYLRHNGYRSRANGKGRVVMIPEAVYRCFCGVEFVAPVKNVRNETIRSCGCLKTFRMRYVKPALKDRTAVMIPLAQIGYLKLVREAL